MLEFDGIELGRRIHACHVSVVHLQVLRVTVGSEELCANHRVTQIVEVVQQFEKDRKLFALLEKYHASRRNRILIFVLYKKEAADLQGKPTPDPSHASMLLVSVSLPPCMLLIVFPCGYRRFHDCFRGVCVCFCGVLWCSSLLFSSLRLMM